MLPQRLPLLLFSTLAVLFPFIISSCGGVSGTNTQAASILQTRRAIPVGDDELYSWQGEGVPGDLTVKIDLSDQRAYYYKGSQNVGWSYVATGKDGHRTPTGNFRVTEKIADKHSNLYGWIEDQEGNMVNPDATPKTPKEPGQRYVPAPMPYWMRLTSYGIGMHAGIIPQPGRPASHGCIRLPKPFAPILFEHARVGTRVKIVK